jgi:hypothetical protein
VLAAAAERRQSNAGDPGARARSAMSGLPAGRLKTGAATFPVLRMVLKTIAF